MKLTKSEKCAIVISFVFLALALGYVLGQRGREGTFAVTESTFSAQRERPSAGAGDDVGVIKNINTASAAELETLEGIGPVLAERIIEYRESEGGFRVIEDITKVRGIGASVFDDIRDHICVD